MSLDSVQPQGTLDLARAVAELRHNDAGYTVPSIARESDAGQVSLHLISSAWAGSNLHVQGVRCHRCLMNPSSIRSIDEMFIPSGAIPFS